MNFAGESQRPNFVIILADDLGFGDLGCYGNSEIRTPHIDRMAREGMRFTDFHSSGAVCSPTRAGLLTGRYQQRAGIPGVLFADPSRGKRHHGLHPTECTFSRLLHDAGYTTGIFGKWHLGYETQFNPVRHGFDEFRGFVGGNVDYFSHIDQAGFYDWWHNESLVEEEGYTTHLITKHAARFISENADRPFCCYIAHEAVHSPYQGPGDAPIRTRDGRTLPGRKDQERAYREMTEELDRGVGEILDLLERLGIAGRTFVFFFSDNGATKLGSNGPLRGGKGTVWEGGHRVPAIAYWPGRIPAGVEQGALTISLDVMPTILALAGVGVPKGHKLDGVDLGPLLFESRALGERALFWEHGDAAAMRSGDWKLVVEEDGRTELYNLRDDLAETRDLGGQFPDRVQEMSRRIGEWRADVHSGATVQPEPGEPAPREAGRERRRRRRALES